LIHALQNPEMTKTKFLPYVFVLLSMLVAGGAAAQDKKIIFSGQTPAGEVTLDPAEPVRIGVDGNVTARCKTDQTGKCIQTGFGTTGGGGGCASPPCPIPTVSIAADSFSTTPDAQQRYSAGTSFRIVSTVSAEGEACTRFTQTGTPAGTNWTGVSGSPYTNATIVLGSASSTYQFGLRCFGSGGAANSNIITVETNASAPPTGDQCNPATLAAVDASRPGFTDAIMTIANGGFNGVPVTQSQPGVQTSRFTDTVGHANLQACGEFPNVGTNQCKIHAGPGQFISIKFEVPTAASGITFPPAREFDFLPSQEAGVPTSGNLYYVTISQCPGDFRLPTSATAPANDPTLSYGCRNARPQFAGSTNIVRFGKVNYNLDVASDSDSCGLARGNTYYLNYVSADPVPDGITAGENTCPEPTLPPTGPGYCGVQFRTN
jgi:hypothetical protein